MAICRSLFRILIAVASLPVLSGCADQTIGNVGHGVAVHEPESSGRLASLAVQSEQDGRVEEAGYLEQAALNQMERQPVCIPEVWGVVKTRIGSQSNAASPAKTLRRLRAFEAAVVSALVNCESQKDFKTGWQVRLDVQAAVEEQRTVLIKVLTARLGETKADLQKSLSLSSSTKLVQKLEQRPEWASMRESFESVMDLARATPVSPAGSSGRGQLDKAIAEIADMLLKQTKKEIAGIREQTQKQIEEDKHGNSPEPASNGAKGFCQVCIVEMGQIQSNVDETNLRRWLSWSGKGEPGAVWDELNKVFAATVDDLQRHQQVRYNLWAITQIHAAETSPVSLWPQRLGQLDTRLLHPAVSTLYSMAYDSELKGLDDAEQRPVVIRKLINQPKVKQEQF